MEALATGGCFSLDLLLPFSVTYLCEHDIQGFCLDVLENPDRCLPLIVVSPTDEGRFLIDTEILARRLFGLALVYQLANPIAVQILKEYLGAPLACYNGTIRLYWPNFHPGDRNTMHDYWTATKQRSFSEENLHQRLFQLAAQSSPRYFDIPSQLKALEQKQRMVERHHREEQLARLQHMSSSNAEAEQLCNAAFAESDKHRCDADHLKNEKQELLALIHELKSELQTHRDNWTLHPHWQDDPVDGNRVANLPEYPELQILLSAEAHSTLQLAPSNQREEFEQELRTLCNPEIRRNQSKTIRRRMTDCIIFPQGDKAVRIFYYEHPDSSVRVCELADHRGSSYERLIEQRKVFKQNYSEDGFTALELFQTT